MHIKELELENFKSFKHQKFVFNKGVTAITGPNGSGKSNIFDALLFVLGNNSSIKLRYKKISDLICRDQKEKVATVRLVFSDNSSIERTVTEDNSVFRLNGKRTTQESIVSFLKELKISSDGHNLVQQGNNKKIIDMSDVERKKLLEDIAQVSLFDDQREKSEKNLDFVKNKISQAKSIMEERKEFLETLEKEKAIAEKYLEIKEKETILKGVILKREKISIDHDIVRTQKRIDSLKETVPYEKNKIQELKSEIEFLGKELLEKKKDYKEEFEKFSKYESHYSVIKYKFDSIKSEINILNNKLIDAKSKKDSITIKDTKKLESEITDFEKEIKELKIKLDSYNIKEMQEAQESLNKKIEGIDKKIADKYSLYYDLKAKLDKNKELEKEKQDAVSELSKIDGKILDLKETLKDVDALEHQLQLYNKIFLDTNIKLEDLILELNKAKEKKMDFAYKINSFKNEISYLKNLDSNSNDLIVVNSEKEIDSFVSENLKKNIFGKLFFVLAKNLNDVKSHIIIKEVSASKKIGVLEKEISKYEALLLDLDDNEKTLKSNYDSLKKESYSLEEKIDSLRKNISNANKENKENESQILFLENMKKELIQKTKLNLESIPEIKLSNIQDEIVVLQEEKNSLGKIDLNDYFEFSNNLSSLSEKLQTKTIEFKEIELSNKLLLQELKNLELYIVEYNSSLKEKEYIYNELQKEVLDFESQKKLHSEKVKNKESILVDCETKIKLNENDLANSKSNIIVAEQDLEEQSKNLFLKEENLLKKIDEIKKYIELNQNISIEKLDSEYSNYHNVGIKELQNNYYDSLTELNAFGNVNLKSIEDYGEYLEKYNTILIRVEQLEKESDEIKEKIKEIQAEKEQRFLSTFNLINENFYTYLNTLNLGDLGLNIEKNSMSEISGVSIKSKKRGTISLSGGEKALVTISFLFAVLALEPACFYLLDEIDADLDYNNSEKIFSMLNELGKEVQIMMVTHNPVVVNKADNVIGVSKSAQGITTVFVKQANQEVSNL